MLKSKIHLALVAILLSAWAMQASAQTVAPATKQEVARLIAVIESDAPLKEKADACRLLSIVGTEDAIEPLSKLLGDEKLSHMARYALEPMPDPAVDQAFRSALGNLKGRPLIGVITSLGVRQDTKAVAQLGALLSNSDLQVVDAAARALGDIGNPAAAAVLKTALPGATEAKLLSLCRGLFRTAETLAGNGQKDQAVSIYEQLRSFTKAPHQVRTGALRGAILTRKDGLSLLRESLRSNDYLLFAAAAKTTMEMPGEKVTDVLTSELAKLPTDNKILLIQTLGQRGDAAALPTISAMVREGDKPVRLAAIKALPRIEKATGLALMGLFDDTDRDISDAAKENFAAIDNPAIDDIVLKMFESNDTSTRLTALELMGRRRMTARVHDILKATGDTDAQVRQAAIRKVGELGGPGQLSALLDLLADLSDPHDLEAARQSIGNLCAKTANPESSANRLAGLLPDATPQQKIVLLRVLSGIGGAKALKTVRAAVDNPDSQVHAAAIRALGTWNTPDAAPELLQLAASSMDKSDRTLCLRGYLGIAARPNLPPNQRLQMCRDATPVVKSDDEKKMLLAALGRIDSPNAITMILTYLKNPSTTTEAATAALGIAERLLKGRNSSKMAPRLVEPLQMVANAGVNTRLAETARTLLKQAKNKAPGARTTR